MPAKGTDLTRIAVCVKQVPVAAALTFDHERGTIVRNGLPSEVNSFDTRALLGALAFRAADAPRATVDVYTMGPPQAVEALRFCLALGADRAFHLCDGAFAGSDTLATALALSHALRREQPELVFFGRNSTDSDTGHVGPQVAELLGWPHVTSVQEIRLIGSDTVRAVRQTDEGLELVEAPLPLVVTAAEDIAPERWPSRAEREEAQGRGVVVLTAADLSPAGRYGLEGSPTFVASVRTVRPVPRRSLLLEEQALDEKVRTFAEHLGKTRGTGEDEPVVELERNRADIPGHNGRRHLPEVGIERRLGADEPDGILVIAEFIGDRIRPVTLELLSKARELAGQLGCRVQALAYGHDAARHVPSLAGYGASTVHLADTPGWRLADAAQVVELVVEVARHSQPRIILFPSTSTGRDVAPRVAARLRAGLTSDCIDLELDSSDGRLVQHKSGFGDNVVALIRSRTVPEMATVRPGMLELGVPDPSRAAHVNIVRHDSPILPRVRIRERLRRNDLAVDALETAATVIGVGMGIGGTRRLNDVEELAALLGASIGATRKVADQGWLPRQHQIGLSGRVVAPATYIALGVRGAYEHIVGVQRAGTIIAVNNDPDSMIFDHADLGIVADCETFVPAVIAYLADQRRSAQVSAARVV